MKIFTQKYPRMIADEHEAQACIADFKSLCNGRNVYLWGANTIGKHFLELFDDFGVSVSALIDRNAVKIGDVDGIPVREASLLKELTADDILIASANPGNFKSMQTELANINPGLHLEDGDGLYSTLKSAYCTLRSKSVILPVGFCCIYCFNNKRFIDCETKIDNIKKNKEHTETSGGVDIGFIDVSIGNVCNFNCKYCLEALPYIPKNERKFYDAKTVISEIKQIASVAKFVTHLGLSGMETFLHPNLAEIISEVKKIRNIGVIEVVSNGTVIPSPKLIEQLRDDWVYVSFSNYSQCLSEKQSTKIENTYQLFIDEDIPFAKTENATWLDMNSFEFCDDREETLVHRYKNCPRAKIVRVNNGIFYVCSHERAGVVRGFFKPEQVGVDIRGLSADELKEKLREYMSRPFLYACNYCEMPFRNAIVPAGEQLE
ncbi:hypothetical protein AGMMS50276_28630 [Synergistales bacterium]|nr:hypothetical protein AGMMS50276_28630 [Synergistales bacterium]